MSPGDLHDGAVRAMIGAMAIRHLDSLVARGNTSDVYRWGTDSIVKVLRPGIPDDWAIREARTTDLVHAAGLPAPAVLGLTTVEGRPGIIFEQVTGASMWEQMLANPRDVPRLTLQLVELQADVNATPAPAGLPRLIDRLTEHIQGNPFLSASERNTAQAALDAQADDEALCHFDVHPNNMIMGAGGPVIIDWFDAAAGSPSADVVRSSVLMRDDAASCHLPCGDTSVIGEVHDQYMASVVRRRHIDVDGLLGWESPVLAARLAEPLVESSVHATLELWRGLHALQPSRLASSSQSAGRSRTSRD